MSKDYLEQAKQRQRRYNNLKKKQGFKKIQVYISEQNYQKLLEMKENKNLSFSEIISASIVCKFRTWRKYYIYN